MKDKLRESLRLLEIDVDKEPPSREILVLKTLLFECSEKKGPVSVTHIRESMIKDDPTSKITRSWLHRVLKRLSEKGVIRTEHTDSRSKHYFGSLDTVVTGLEKIREEKSHELEQQIAERQNKLDHLSSMDCIMLGEDFVREITGEKRMVSSRMIRGVEEMHRVIGHTIDEYAQEGDIIRSTVLWPKDLVEGSIERTQKYIKAAKRGVDVRYLMTPELMATVMGNAADDVAKTIGELMELRKSGAKFDARLYSGSRTYTHVMINNERMALVLTETPLTATYVTREFNSDLIDNVIDTFDKQWEVSPSIFEPSQELVESTNPEFVQLLSKLFQGEKE